MELIKTYVNNGIDKDLWIKTFSDHVFKNY